MNLAKKILILLLLISFISFSINSESFNDSFKSKIGLTLRVYVKYGSGGNFNMSFEGQLKSLGDNFIVLLEDNQEVYIKYDDISSYKIIPEKKKK